MDSQTLSALMGFDPQALPREFNRHYIAASDAEIDAMLAAIGKQSLADLYAHVPADSRFNAPLDLPEELDYAAAATHLQSLAQRNTLRESFIGDGLPHFEQMPIVNKVAAIRNLTTAYTPYQPERSQGTLQTHWVYQCLMSQITGFEAINSSLYERSTALFEALTTAVRLARKADAVIVSEGIHPNDREVIETLFPGTDISLTWIPLDPETGQTDRAALDAAIAAMGSRLAAVAFPHVNHLGILEDVDALTDAIAPLSALSIAVIDPALLGSGGLKPPTDFGSAGVDMLVGEAQHLAIGPNFGGPGLGLFGVRHNAKQSSAIRQTPGRYVGKASDDAGRPCHVMVLSTREQHIRKDKATSNICSNQAFLATMAGAAILERGESGMAACFATATRQAREAATLLCQLSGIQLAWPTAPFVNEFVIEVPVAIAPLIEAGRAANLHIGVDVSTRMPGQRNLLKVSFSDRSVDVTRLQQFFIDQGFARDNRQCSLPSLPPSALRSAPLGLPQFDAATILDWYQQLGKLNMSPDDACYPLGSCTMKYNPHLNDWAANLEGFTAVHPQAPIGDVQGSLEVLFHIQEWFKAITGLAAVTTQPVAGAQGELVGIKLFQAYHAAKGEAHRDVILIPASAHGTNFATASMAGFRNRKLNGRTSGIVLLEANADGQIDLDDLRAKIELHAAHLAGVMITNPNTCGIFESHFRQIAEWVHAAGGLVYMDGANMNAIAGWCDLGAMGVDAVHNNLHKTWTIPHGGGGPGDAIVAVSERLAPFLPGFQIVKEGTQFTPVRAPRSIGSFHRHWGNFAHKVRAYAYLVRLGRQGVPRMTAMAVLSANYCLHALKANFPSLPANAAATPRMHEFILTLRESDFAAIEAIGVPKALAIPRIGKLFLDFGFHAPTVAWPEPFGLMIEPTESYTKAELDRFCEAVNAIADLVRSHPQVLRNVPIFTPIDRVDEVAANRNLVLSEPLDALPALPADRLDFHALSALPVAAIKERILQSLNA